ncbi:ABC transporter ATP-binding protein/permease [bacterium]|nr:ABC transporter ATP-binding protein/permease [bacterium]
MVILKLENVSKVYELSADNETYALSEINLSFEEKGLSFIVGRSGSGKTTLLNIISAIDSPTSGDIFLSSNSYKNLKDKDFELLRNKYIGNIFQEYLLIPYYTVGENIKIALDLNRDDLDTDEKINLINETLKKVSLVDSDGNTFYNRKISELSGGEKQRVAIARALIKKPKILLADEPTGALDYETGKEILNLLKTISLECQVIIVSHDIEFAEKYADRIIKLSDGKIESDTSDSIAKEEIKEDLFESYSKSKIPFKSYLKMGLYGFKYKKFRLFLTIIILLITSFISFFLITILDMNISNASIKNAYRNFGYAFLEGYGQETPDKFNDYTYIEYDKNNLKKEYIKDYGCIPVFSFDDESFIKTIPLSKNTIEYYRSQEIFLNNPSFDNIIRTDLLYISCGMEYDDNLPLEVDSRFVDKDLCHPPMTINEIALSDIKAQIYMDLGFVDEHNNIIEINTPDDLIGKKIGDFTICGVYSTPESKIIFEKRLIWNSNNKYDPIENAVINGLDFAISSKWFYCNDYIEKVKAQNIEGDELIDIEVSNQYILPSNKSIIEDIKFIKNITFKDDFNVLNTMTASTIFTSNVDFIIDAKEYVETTFILVAILIVFILLTLLELMIYLNVTISRRKKEFSILLSLGAGFKDLRKIVLIESIFTCLILLVLLYLLSFVSYSIINAKIFIIPVLSIGTLMIVISIVLTIGFSYFSTLISSLTIKKISPKEMLIISNDIE